MLFAGVFMINFFTIDPTGTITFANINDARHSECLVTGNNVWREYSGEEGTVFYHACLKALHHKETVFLETYYASDDTWWEKQIYPSENGLAVYLRDITQLKRLRNDLHFSKANLSATINNTEVVIWSVDANLKLVSFNKAFEGYVALYYGGDSDQPVIATDTLMADVQDSYLHCWIDMYRKVLAGERLTFENSRFGKDFYYSLSPIVENGIVTGVSAFAHNITDQNKRERELQQARTEIDRLKRAALRTAMDSHFIFSTLNAIQNYIVDYDRENAVRYLATFSRLIRSVLDSTLAEKTMLSKELDLVKNYVALEQMRAGDYSFLFEMNIADDVDTAWQIPPMIIQPFIENAIVHGLKQGKVPKGKITLTVCAEDGKLTITIADNGIGRRDSTKEKNSKRFHSTRMTEERLKLMSTSTDPVSIALSDNNGGGTQVIILIPLEYVMYSEIGEQV